MRAGYEVVLLTRVDRHRQTLEAAGIRVVALSWRRRGFRLWRELHALWVIWRTYREERPTVVHHVALKPIVYGSIAARLANVRAVVNAVAGLGFIFVSDRAVARWLRPLLRRGLRWALGGAMTRSLVQNPDDRELIKALGVEEGNVVLIPGSGIDERQFNASLPPPGPIVVAMVSRMLWDKGVAELVQAARMLRERGVEVTVRLFGAAGDDNPASIGERELRAWEGAGDVQWRGFEEDVGAIWRSSHIAVLPSYREGFPRALLEAAASGRPMVATDVPGCREIVRHGVTGLLVPVRDATALADAIERLATDRDARERFGNAARRMVEERFSESVVIAQHLTLYSDIAH